MFQCPWTVADDTTIPKIPSNYDTLASDEQKKLESDRKSEISLKYYKSLTHRDNPRHWAALQLQRQNLEVRTEPSRLVARVWENRDVFFLRRALLEIIAQWEDLCPGSGPCPVSFSEQELKLHEIEEDSMSDAAEIMRLFRDSWGLPGKWNGGAKSIRGNTGCCGGTQRRIHSRGWRGCGKSGEDMAVSRPGCGRLDH